MERLPIVSTEAVEELQRLYDETEPVAGRPGWRRDAQGKEWYSVAWISTAYDNAHGSSRKL